MDSCKTIFFSNVICRLYSLICAAKRYGIVGIILFFSLHGYSQTQQVKTISLDVENVTISSALVQLAMVADFNFSFNSDNDELNRKITYSAVDRSPMAILDDLLEGTGHSYKIVGKQVVVFKDQEREDDKEPAVIVAPTPEVITKYVPRYIYDTVFITDTVFSVVVDTITEIDTVFVDKEKEEKPPNKIKDIPIDYFNQRISREEGWAFGVSVAPLITDFSLAKQEKQFSVRSFSLGVEIAKIYGNWMLKGGLKFTNYAEKYNHNYKIQEGGFFVTDTIDEYYTVSGIDTTFFYVTDSTWKPIDVHEYSYSVNNRIGLLDLGVAVSYDFYTSDLTRFYLVLGGQVGMVVYKDGLAIPYPDQPEGEDFADLKFANPTYSVLGGVGGKFRISKGADINAEVNYLKYVNDIVKDYPSETKLEGVSLKLGVLFYF